MPLILIAFHVNRLTEMARIRRKRKDLNSSTDRPVTRDADDGNSTCSSSGSDSDSDTISSSARALYRNRATQWSDTGSLNNQDDNYAPLFGRYAFHNKIPLVRKLWKYHVYRVHMLGDLDAGFEDFDWDYPLRRFRKRARVPIEKMLLALGLMQLWQFYRGHESKYMHGEYEEYDKEMKEFMVMRERERIAAHLKSLTRGSVDEKQMAPDEADALGEELARTDTKDFETGQERPKVFRRVFSGRRQRQSARGDESRPSGG